MKRHEDFEISLAIGLALGIIISVMTYNLSAQKFDLISRSQVISQVKAMLARDKADKAKAHALYRKAKARK